MNINYSLLKRFSIMALMGSFVLGIFLYYVKHQVIGIEKEIRTIHQKTNEAKESIHVLKAEWGFLNSPKRLQELNQQYVHLKPVKTYQIASLDALKSAKEGPIMLARLEKRP